MKAVLILNDRAGSLNGEKGAVDVDEVIAAVKASGLAAEPRFAPPRQLCETLTRAVAERPDAIFVGGGDGSVSAAARCLADTNIALGVLPLGTLNHFAHDLGLPSTWRDAVAALRHGEARPVDVGEVNDHAFINNCSIGGYPEAVRRRDALRRTHGTGKWWAMTLATFAVFRRLRRLRLTVEANGRTLPLRTPFVVVANNRYSGHVLDYSLRSRLDEGQLWLYTTHSSRHLAILHLIWQSFFREIDAVEGLEKFPLTTATINYDYPQLPVALDGEVVELRAPLRFRIRPGALRVIAPQSKVEVA